MTLLEQWKQQDLNSLKLMYLSLQLYTTDIQAQYYSLMEQIPVLACYYSTLSISMPSPSIEQGGSEAFLVILHIYKLRLYNCFVME